MENVPPPNYTQIPNDLIALFPKMKDAEIRVAMAIARETFGWHRSRKILTIPKLCELTGLSKQGVHNGLEQGMERGLIVRSPVRNSFEYGLNIREETVNEVDQNSQPSRPKTVNEVDQNSQRSRPKTVNEVDYACSLKKQKQQKQTKEKKTTETNAKEVVVVCKYLEAQILAYAQAHSGQDTPEYLRIISPVGFTKSVLDETAKDMPRILQSIGEWLKEHPPRTTTPLPLPGELVPDLLTKFLAVLRNGRVNPTSFLTWFKPIEAMSRGDTKVYFQVSEAKYRDWITQYYPEIVEEALVAIGLAGYQFEFVVSNST